MAQEPLIYEPQTISVGSRLGRELIASYQQANMAVWQDPRSWRGKWYFGYGDQRLWVPRRMLGGRSHPEERVINFCHPMGRRAFRLLVGAYAISFLAVGVIINEILRR